MEYLKPIGEIAKALGLDPGHVMALIALGILYRLSTAKDRVIEKLSSAVTQNTTVMAEIKTLLTVMLGGGKS